MTTLTISRYFPIHESDLQAELPRHSDSEQIAEFHDLYKLVEERNKTPFSELNKTALAFLVEAVKQSEEQHWKETLKSIKERISHLNPKEMNSLLFDTISNLYTTSLSTLILAASKYDEKLNRTLGRILKLYQSSWILSKDLKENFAVHQAFIPRWYASHSL